MTKRTVTPDCGHTVQVEGLTTGYGTDPKTDKTYCYACCAKTDRRIMQKNGCYYLYLDIDKKQVTNWPGSLRYDVLHIKTGRHNIAGARYDVWFQDEYSSTWHGIQYGDNTQILHCHRLKDRFTPPCNRGRR